MRRWTALIVVVLGALVAVVWPPNAANAASTAPYPPITCASIAVSTTTPQPGQSITVTGTGFTAHAAVRLVLRSTPVTLARVTSDANGQFRTVIVLPDDATGQHDLLAVGGATTICPADPLRFTISTPGTGNSGGPGLSHTGFDVVASVAIALGLIGAGLAFTRGGARRRRRGAHAA